MCTRAPVVVALEKRPKMRRDNPSDFTNEPSFPETDIPLKASQSDDGSRRWRDEEEEEEEKLTLGFTKALVILLRTV
jgi:hypothetical protein